jgi:hypothetical protein
VVHHATRHITTAKRIRDDSLDRHKPAYNSSARPPDMSKLRSTFESDALAVSSFVRRPGAI